VNKVMINVQQKMKPNHWTLAHREKKKKKKKEKKSHTHSRQKLTSSPCTFNTYVKKGWMYECKHGREVNFIPINHKKIGISLRTRNKEFNLAAAWRNYTKPHSELNLSLLNKLHSRHLNTVLVSTSIWIFIARQYLQLPF